MVLDDFRIDELAMQRFEAFERAFLVRSHQPRVTGNISGEDRRKTAARDHFSGNPMRRRPSIVVLSSSA